MTIDGKIRNEKLQHDIHREAVSALLSGKVDKCECLTGEEILPSDQFRVVEQGKLTYSPLGRALKRQTKTFENQGKKQIYALKLLKRARQLTIKD